MATIIARKQPNGATRYTAVVRLRQGAVVLHHESKTFTHRTAAASWAKAREIVLEDPASPLRRSNQPRTLAASRPSAAQEASTSQEAQDVRLDVSSP